MSIERIANKAPINRLHAGSWNSSHPGSLRRIEISLAIILTAVCCALHFIRLLRAGGLWRDEAAVVGLANLSPIQEVFNRFPHEAFPLPFPLMVRGLTELTANSDPGFRVFGLLVGLASLGALWLNLLLVRRGVPLLSLALLGFNGAFIQWGDSLRGYGLGTVFIILSLVLFWRLLEKPAANRLGLAALGAVCAAQCLFHNPPLILGICLGAVAVAMRRRAIRVAAMVIGAGASAAISLLPYFGPLQHARGWDMLVRAPSSALDLLPGLEEVLSASGWSNTWVWALLFLVAIAICWRGQAAALTEHDARDVQLFAGVALVAGLAGCLGFLLLLGYAARPWYFLALLGLAAVLLDIVFDTLPHSPARKARVVLAVLIAITSLPLAWRQANTRQTNIDLIAATLNRSVAREDVVVVSPWFMGISFDRYYKGAAPWGTVPPLNFHKFHRYDLIQSQMELPAREQALEPLKDQIRAALKGGHRVWFVGLLTFTEEHPRNEPTELVQTLSWSHELAMFLRASARHLEVVPIECNQPVNRFENLTLRKIDGWSAN
jgi:hypothetical protein